MTAPMQDEPAIGLAVPIRSHDRLLATLSLRYLGKAMSETEVAKKYLDSLRSLAETIASRAENG